MAGTVEVIYDSADGENFDTVVEQTDPSESPAATDLTFLVGNPMPLLRGDKELYDGSDLSAAIFTQRGSKGQRNPGPELEEKPPSRSHIDLLAEQKHLEWLEAKEYEARIPEKEEQREEHRAESDIANKRLKALTLKLRRLNVQLESSVKARRLLNEEIARSRWGSTSNLEALYEQLRALNRQIESLSKRVGWVRTQISILKEVRRREDEAIKKLTYEIEKMKLGINRLDYPDPFVDFMEEKIFDPIFDRILP